MYRPSQPYEHGMLAVGDGHTIYWEACGNPRGKPAVVLHGGPGSGANASWTELLNPDRYRIVLFDQRGCGRSTPNAARTTDALRANTTADLIGDIEVLRGHLAIERWLVLGASWGSILGLAYAEQHPQSVSEIVLSAIADGSQVEVDWLTRGAGRYLPEEWARFRDGVPEQDRDGDLSAAYHRLLLHPDPAVHELAALDWCTWDDLTMRLPDEPPARRYADPAFRLCSARVVTHYWSNGHWLEDGQLLEGATSLSGIPGVLVHGALDLNQPTELLWRLARDWPESELVLVAEDGHGGAAMDAETVRATDRFASTWGEQ